MTDHQPPPTRIGLASVASTENLSLRWRKQVGKGLKDSKLDDLYLPQDPIGFVAFDWSLKPILGQLSASVLQGRYSPRPAEILRGAKQSGMSRKLAYLTPEDSLIYHALVYAVRKDLEDEQRPWTGAGKGQRASTSEDADEDDGQGSPYIPFDWFLKWLNNQGRISDIAKKFEYVVESDIANFFATLDHQVVEEHLLAQTRLGKEAVRLCTFIVERTIPTPEYTMKARRGIPQEIFNSSRAIAHSLLIQVDEHFDQEGEQSKYTRFVDDFAFGAESRHEAEHLVSRLQAQIDRLGLNLNSGKTRIISATEFYEDLLPEDNGFLSEFEDSIGPEPDDPLRQLGVDSETEELLLARASQHRNSKSKNRPKAHDRVLRRYYTAMRDIGCDAWLTLVCDDIMDEPAAARSLLEYARSFPLTEDMVERLFDLVSTTMNRYDDVPLFALETLATAPNNSDLSGLIASHSTRLIGKIKSPATNPHSLEDWIMAYLVPIIFKFCSHIQASRLIAKQYKHLSSDTAARVQSDVALAAIRNELPDTLRSDSLTFGLIDAIRKEQEAAVASSIRAIRPTIRLRPNRYLIRPRVLFLVPILSYTNDGQIGQAVAGAVDLLRTNPQRLQDGAQIALLSEHSV